MPSPKCFAFVMAVGTLSLLLGACQVVAGIEERKLDPNYGDSQQCIDYCKLAMDKCTGEFAVYPTEEQCLAVCAKMDPGDPQEQSDDNTVACRARLGQNADREPDTDCPILGPTGGNRCGSPCDAYCKLYPQICPDSYLYPDTATCLKFCDVLFDDHRYSLTEDHEGDSVECRLVHTSAAAIDPETHCPHAVIPPTDPYCTADTNADPDPEPNCDGYCKIEEAACDEDLAQYENDDQCHAVCAALDLGNTSDEAENTVGCRRYHAFSASLDPETHCYHSGPTGDGHCGDHATVKDGHTGNCESYCTLVAKACPDEFDASFGSDNDCMAACIKLPEAEPDSKYTVAKAKKSTGLQCRILATTRAFADASQCAAAVGGDPCK